MLTEDENQRLQQVTDFWFTHLKPEDWFVRSDQVDQDITDGFSQDYVYFKDRDLDSLDLTGEQVLAAIILFDQMPRNMFRDSAQAFETDGLSRSLCTMALAGGLDLKMSDIKKSFLYLPLEHSEDLRDQELCVSLFEQRTKLTEQIDYAVRHHDVISRFGRFPHRNATLGRASTPKEDAYLTGGGDSF
ncbi:MAG: hypothetical protein COB54_01685 [Alphaproteobacteria bacterium]|nr:MAG: hypothetical protein COB54_01685 [Alphaproteobacteria bacterium]